MIGFVALDWPSQHIFGKIEQAVPMGKNTDQFLGLPEHRIGLGPAA
jgi:hypothetical protein